MQRYINCLLLTINLALHLNYASALLLKKIPDSVENRVMSLMSIKRRAVGY